MRRLSVLTLVAASLSAAAPLPSGAQTAAQTHDTVRASLVHLSGSAQPTTGPNAGEVDGAVSQGTGFVISADGLVLTTDHFLDAFREVKAINADFKGRIGDAAADPLTMHYLTSLPQLDLALFKLKIPFGTTPPPALVLGETFAIDADSPPDLLTSGFVEEQYVRRSAALTETSNPSVPYAWTLDARVIGGQSGSPIYTMDGTVIGIAKATDDVDTETALMIPMEYALPLTAPLKFAELTEEVEELRDLVSDLAMLVGEMQPGSQPLHPRLTNVERGMLEIGKWLMWDVQIGTFGELEIVYEKVIPGEPSVESILVTVQPYIRVADPEGSTVWSISPTLTLEQERFKPVGQVGTRGKFVIQNVRDQLDRRLETTENSVGGSEPFLLEVSFTPRIDGRNADMEKFTVIPRYWRE